MWPFSVGGVEIYVDNIGLFDNDGFYRQLTNPFFKKYPQEIVYNSSV